MRPRPRLLPALLLNIFVSALVVGTVLFFYDRAHRVECVTTLPNTSTASTANDGQSVKIAGVIGVGTLVEERIVIQNDGMQEAVLTGWYLADNKGLVYTFPQLTLSPGVRVQVHTASGKDTPIDLYWGRSDPAWRSGELVALYDNQAIARAFYRIP